MPRSSPGNTPLPAQRDNEDRVGDTKLMPSFANRFDPILSSILWIALGVILISIVMVQLQTDVGTTSLLGGVATAVAAIAIALHSKMKTYSFASWVICFVVIGILYPKLFLETGPIPGVKALSMLVQIAMFGMGATLTFRDFERVIRTPKPVAVGFLLQFSCMPLLGWSVSKMLMLPPEIAVGVILIGSCPGGVASNVITYLAKGNVALSVTMTACTTLAAPVMTPLMMYWLAGQEIPINYMDMMQSIFMTVFIPVVAGMICNALLTRFNLATKTAETYLAMLSMLAICLVCGIIAANSVNEIRSSGFVLVLAVLLHNNLGYLLGYWGARLARCDEADSRTVAIEVGLQNGGMGAMLATTVLKNASAAVAPALFGPLMNITGSVLAAWWSRNPAKKS